MAKHLQLIALSIILFSLNAFGQGGSGTLKGVIKNSSTGETVPFVNIIVEAGGNQVSAAQSNIDGEFTIKPIEPGSYVLKASSVGFKPKQVSNIIVSGGKITTVNVNLDATSIDIKEFEKVEYDVPLIDDKQGQTLTREEIVALPTRNIQSVAATTGGVTQADEGRAVNIRGSRDDATFYFIDGIKVRGSTNLPQQGIEQIQVITGGVPAMYGDLTGGVISITTRGPSRQINGGLELVRSVDGFGYNLLGFNLTGPVYSKRNADGTKKPIVGFFIAGELLNVADNSPSAIGNTAIRPDRLDELERNPLRIAPLGVGTTRNSLFVTNDDFINVKRKQNSELNRVSLSGKLDFKLNSNSTLTFGGTWDYLDRNEWIYTYSMFNYKNNPRRVDNTYRVYGKFTQRLGNQQDEEKSASVIKNIFYSIQADYSQNFINRGNENHWENFFDYGHLGKFQTFKVPIFDVGVTDVNGVPITGFVQSGFRDTLFSFQQGDRNPLTSNYTRQYYELANGVSDGNYQNFSQVLNGGGLLNGDNPQSVYALFQNTGTQFNGYTKLDNQQLRLVGNLSADVKGHEIGFGFEYEQRTDRSWFIAPVGLWGVMRQLANKHIAQLDLNNPIMNYNSNGQFNDTITYNRLYSESDQATFDRNLRLSLGLAPNSTQWLDIDNYDPSTFNVSMFSADELLNGGAGASLVSYFGYTHDGNKIRGRRSIDDFVNGRDANGNFTREIGAFNPIYFATYLQDKFVFRDLIFNVGLRIDRFDANQPVLQDPFSLYETRKAREFEFVNGQSRPSNIGDDYVVYVRDINSTDLVSSNIVGYRNGVRWYNAQGTEIQDPIVLAQASSTGRISPALVNPEQQVLSGGAFRDYQPQLNVMPRVAFQFPISDVAQFFAHYDVLTQRPTDGIRFDPLDYYFIQANIGNVLANPNLQPQKTIDYEVGFKQVLSKSSALTITAFYRELRNLIQVIPVNYAYPINYFSYGNIDFGTIKGMTISYDLRRTGNVRLTANYTLQFADGTGSSSTGSFNAINQGQPNLRTTVPLSFDVRHQFQTTFDYRYGAGKFYNGPRLFGKDIFADAGANFVILANSGTPYTRSSVFTEDGSFGNAGRPQLAGSINGSRLPFQFRINARADKNFDFTYKKGEGDNKRDATLNIYILVQNLLDARNVLGVYRATGDPSNDGWLTAPNAQQIIAGQVNPASYAQIYTAKINNPNNFSLPRIIRLGAILSF